MESFARITHKLIQGTKGIKHMAMSEDLINEDIINVKIGFAKGITHQNVIVKVPIEALNNLTSLQTALQEIADNCREVELVNPESEETLTCEVCGKITSRVCLENSFPVCGLNCYAQALYDEIIVTHSEEGNA